MSWFPVAHRLADAGIDVARVKGKRVKALRRYLSEHAKTDLADAQVLAALPGFGGPQLDPVHIPAAKSHALQRLTKQRGRLRDDLSAAKRRLLDLIRWASPELERVLPDLGTRLSLALLQRWLDPDAVQSARRATLRKFSETSARADASLDDLDDHSPKEVLAVAMAKAVARRVVTAWEGVGDDAGEPLVLTPAGIDALLDLWPVFEAFQERILGPHLVLDAEKNASAPSPHGTTAAAIDTVRAAKPGRKPARAAQRG